MSPEISGQGQEGETRWGIPVDRDLQAGLLEYLRGCVSPQRSKDIPSTFKKHQLEVEQHLDLMTEAKLVQYKPIERAAWGWIALRRYRILPLRFRTHREANSKIGNGFAASLDSS